MDQSTQDVNPAKLFVGNLPYQTTADTLRELFSQFGTVVDAVVLADKFTGRSKGFGFVTMSTADEANAAVDGLNEHEMDGRKMVVNVARPRAPRDDRPRGGFGGGRSGGSSGGYDNRRSSSSSSRYGGRDSR